MPLIALAGVLVPFVFAAAELAYVVIPRKIFNSAHDLAVVFEVIKGRVVENKVVACGNFSQLKALGNFSAVVKGNARAVKIIVFSVYLFPTGSM